MQQSTQVSNTDGKCSFYLYHTADAKMKRVALAADPVSPPEVPTHALLDVRSSSMVWCCQGLASMQGYHPEEYTGNPPSALQTTDSRKTAFPMQFVPGTRSFFLSLISGHFHVRHTRCPCCDLTCSAMVLSALRRVRFGVSVHGSGWVRAALGRHHAEPLDRRPAQPRRRRRCPPLSPTPCVY